VLLCIEIELVPYNKPGAVFSVAFDPREHRLIVTLEGPSDPHFKVDRLPSGKHSRRRVPRKYSVHSVTQLGQIDERFCTQEPRVHRRE
jgi:hypothetical protein